MWKAFLPSLDGASSWDRESLCVARKEGRTDGSREEEALRRSLGMLIVVCVEGTIITAAATRFFMVRCSICCVDKKII